MISNLYIKISKVFLTVPVLLLYFFTANITYAQNYIPLEALPGVSKEGTNLSSYLSAIFNIGIGLAGALAVLMIVVGGIGYIAGASNPSARSEAKKKITDAIIGLILAMASWLILYTVNPDLLKNKLKITPISIASPKTDTKQVGVTSDINKNSSIKKPIPTPLIVNPSQSEVVSSGSNPSSFYQSDINPANSSQKDAELFFLNNYTSQSPKDINKNSYTKNSSSASPMASSPQSDITYSVPSLAPIYKSSYNSSQKDAELFFLNNYTSQSPKDINNPSGINFSGVKNTGSTPSKDSGQLPYTQTQLLPLKIDTTNDYNLIKDCALSPVSGVCSNADINSDGIIDVKDLIMISSAFNYNVNRDKVINYKKGPNITSCFFKESSGAILPPDPPCYASGTSECASVPEVQQFPVKCATSSSNDKILTRVEFNTLKNVLKSSSYPYGSGKVNLRRLYSNLFNACTDDYSTGPCDLFGDIALGQTIYSTIIQYDTNKDGIADFSGGDPLADFNGDGVVDKKDKSFVDFLNKNIFKDSKFPPVNFTLGGLEALMFNSSSFTDRQVVQYCIGKTPVMDCFMSDIDNSCANVTNRNTCDVDQKDLDKFDANAYKFDINKDGVVNLTPTP